jgi:ubiquinone/menaquinone biosynthesis C-methylase UbiE
MAGEAGLRPRGREEYPLRMGMRATWDAAAASDRLDAYVGDPATAEAELEGLFGRLGDDPRGGVCVEVGCGPGRMTPFLAERFDRVLAVDVSPAMLDAARMHVSAPNVELRVVSGTRLDSVEDAVADVLVCYLVLQHLPHRAIVLAHLREFARVLAPGGRAFVHLPVLVSGIRPRAWRLVRSAAVPLSSRLTRDVAGQGAYRGFRLTERELERGLRQADLRVAARDESADSPYRFAREVFLRLERD